MGFSLRLERFCCCCDIRTGTLIIGTLGWLSTLTQIFVTPSNMQMQNDYYHQHSQSSLSDTIAARIGACLVSLLVSVLLIVGVYKRNNKYMLPWLVIQCLGCILVTIGFFICFVLIFLVPSPHAGLMVGITISILLLGCFSWYCWICVWSHYMELGERETPTAPNVQYSPSHVNPPPYNKAGGPLV